MNSKGNNPTLLTFESVIVDRFGVLGVQWLGIEGAELHSKEGKIEAELAHTRHAISQITKP